MDTAKTPPRGDYQKAENYIAKLVDLVESGKLQVVHTDLQKFDPGSIQDHYRLDLQDYQIEISHSKLPNSGADSYVMLFTNLKNVGEGSAEKAILAYTQLSNNQFNKFKTAAESQIEERRRLEEEKRFNEALSPIDSLLDEAQDNAQLIEKNSSLSITEDNEPEVVKEASTVEMSEENNPPLPSYSTIASAENKEETNLPKPDSNPYF